MNTPSALYWLQTLGVLALQITFLLALAGLAQRLVHTARRQRALWLAALVAAAGLTTASLVGMDELVTAGIQGLAPAKRSVIARGNLPVADAPTTSETSKATHPLPTDTSVAPRVEDLPRPCWWPAWAWLAGAGVLISRALVSRVALRWLGRSVEQTPVALCQAQVQNLAENLGIPHPIRVICHPRLVSPIAFGWLRPTVGVPVDFCKRHSFAEQSAMLAHELAHLASKDPLWHTVVDVVAALLWWHPLVWWARREFLASSELAADEASLVVEGGPTVLASCLVELASRIQGQDAAGWLGVTGSRFRSGLGQRVERLLGLPSTHQWSRGSSLGVLGLLGASISVGLLVEVGTVLVRPQDASGPPSLLAMAKQVVAAESPSAEPPTKPSPAQPEPLSTQSVAPISYQWFKGTNVVQIPSPAASMTASTNLFTRMFKLDPNTMSQNLKSAFGKTNENLSAQEFLRRYVAATGLDIPLVSEVLQNPNPPSGKAMLYNDRTGMLLVRATLQDLDTLEAGIQALNDVPPQVLIEAKFVEITMDDTKAIGFDWYLGNTLMGGQSNLSSSLRPSGGVFPSLGSNVAQGYPASTNRGTQELRGDQLDWAGRNLPGSQNARVSAAKNGSLLGIFTEQQYAVLMRALEQRSGVDVLSAPKVTTVSGRQAQIQVVDLKTIVTGANPAALIQPNQTTPPPTNLSSLLTAQVPLGPVVDLIPNVSADGRTINLRIIASLTEFLGYDEPPKGATTRVWREGKAEDIPLPLPHFRVRQMESQATIEDGQTIVLGGLMAEDVTKTLDKVAVLGDLPGIGRFFRTESTSTRKKNLLVFVTARIIDPAGNPVNAPRASAK